MYNKNRFHKVNDKKLLHKIGKKWAVLSISLLGVLGAGALSTKAIHASNIDNGSNNSQNQNSVNHSTEQPQTKLVQSNQIPQNGVQTNNSEDSGSVDVNSIQQQATRLHAQIINDGVKSLGYRHDTATEVSGDSSTPTAAQSKDVIHPNLPNITGNWGTAPYTFNPNTGALETTGAGTIAPIKQLTNVSLKDIKYIQFAPGTVAPKMSTGLFAASDIEVPTTDGHYGSDSIAYISALHNLTSIDLTNLDTHNVISMAQMFENDSDLQQITFGPHFNTSNVNEMAQMFQSDNNLKSLDLSSFDTSNVMDMSSMFHSDYALSDLNLGNNFNTQYVNFMDHMFQSDNDLKSLDLGDHFYTSYPQSMSDMFANDYHLTNLNLGHHFNTQTVHNMSDMFGNDSDLSSLDLGDQFYIAQVSDMHNMFKGNTSLKSINLGSHFDTTHADSKKYTKTYNGNSYTSPITLTFKGDTGLFSSDNALNTISANNAKLTNAADLPQINQMTWYQSNSKGQTQGNPVDLTNGALLNGTYLLSTTVPIVQTVLNFQDINDYNKSIGNVLVSGLSGDRIPFAVISNSLGDGYIPAILPKDLMPVFPNTPYQYQPGIINVPVKTSVTTNDIKVPVITTDGYGRSENSLVGSYASHLSDSQIAKYYQDSVEASVFNADQSIENYYRNSVASSVSVINHQKAVAAAQSADQKISESVSASVSTSNQQLAKNAVQSADQSIEDSIANSAAASADQSIVSYYRSSVASSVSVTNHQKAVAAAQSTDQKISESVSASVSTANQQLAKSAAQSADRSIENYYRSSVASSVSTANHQKALKAAQSADQQIRAYYQSSISASVASANQASTNKAASLADQKITRFYQDSVANSVSIADQQAANNAAALADERIEASEEASQRFQQSANDKSYKLISNHLSSANSAISSSLVAEAQPTKHTDSIPIKDNSSVDLIDASYPAGNVDQNQVNKSLFNLELGHKVIIGNRIISRINVKHPYIKIRRMCLAHKHITSIGHIKDYSGILHKGTIVKVLKMFKMMVHHHRYYRYEILLHHRRYFVTANVLYN